MTTRPQAALVLDELAHLLDAGVSLREALGTLAQGRWPMPTRAALMATADRIAAGHPLADALHLAPGVPSPIERATLRGGEQAGRLGIALRRVAARYEGRTRARSALLARLAYPGFLIQLAAFVAALPHLARSTGGFALRLFLLLLLANGSVALAWLLARRAIHRTLHLDDWPILGRWLTAQRQREYLEPLAMLYASGVPWATAHGLARTAASRPPVARRLALADPVVAARGSMIEALRATGLFTAEVDVQLANAEHAGRLEEALDRVVAELRRSEDESQARLVHALGRLVYLAAALFVAIVVIRFWLDYAAQLRRL